MDYHFRMDDARKIRHSVKFNGVINGIQQVCRLLIPVITFPYLSRVLGPEPYGKYSFSNSFISYFLLLGMLGVNTYAIREGARIRNNTKEIYNFSTQVFSLNILFVLISLILLCVVVNSSEKLSNYRLLIFILSFIIPFTCLGRDWINTIYEDYLYITLRYIIVQLIAVVAIFVLIHNNQDYIKYTVIYTISSCLGPFINLIYTQKYIPLRITFHIDLKKHLIPILILFCGQIAVTIYIQSDITMIGLLRSDSEVGIYTVASKIYVLIKSVANAITTVTIPRLVYYLGNDEREQFKNFCIKISGYLITLVLPMTVGLFFESANILLIIGGNKYLYGVESLMTLSFALPFAVFSGFYCNAILIPCRKEKNYMIITILAALVNIIGNYILIPQIGISGAAFTTIVSEIIVCVLCAFSMRSTFIGIRLCDLLSLLIGTTSIVIVCIFMDFLELNYFLSFIMSTILSVAIYSAILILYRNSLAIDVLKMISIKNHKYD